MMSPVPSPTSPAAVRRPVRVPPATFGAAFGLVGLAQCWANASVHGHVPGAVPDVLLVVAALVWAATLAAYVVSARRHPGSLRADLTDPTAAPFCSLLAIVPLLLVAAGLTEHAPDLSAVLVDVLVVLVVLHGAWFTGQLFAGDYPFERLHPGYFLPTVAGGLISSAAASSVGQRHLGQVMLGYGLICWAILGSLIFARLVSGPALPDPLLPTMAIEVAPSAVATLAWFGLHGHATDGAVSAFAGYGALMALAQVRLLPRFARLSFSPGFWAFTFAWAAVANTTLWWIAIAQPAAADVLTWTVLVAVSALVVAVGVRSVLGLARGTYFPRP